jgi:hypothetical protein
VRRKAEQWKKTHEDDIDDPDVDAELDVVTVAPMVIAPLVSIAELILLCIKGIKGGACIMFHQTYVIWTAST